MWRPHGGQSKSLEDHVARLGKKLEGMGEQTELDMEWESLLLTSRNMAVDPLLCRSGKAAGNREKNRYADVLPNDRTRIKLSKTNCSHSDYINSNFIDGKAFCLPHNNYICAQAPTDGTVCDFWRMVWEYDVSLVLMLTKEVENNKNKCARYWPDSPTQDNPNPKMVFGAITVAWQQEPRAARDTPDLSKKHFLVTSHGVTRAVTQVQHTDWPDHGTPSGESFSELLRISDEFIGRCFRNQDEFCQSENTEVPPILVHCSAGIGRTGCFLVIHILTTLYKQYLKRGNPPGQFAFDVLGTISELREQRAGMVQSSQQLRFIYTELLNEVRRILRDWPKDATLLRLS
ncbi:Tyrosine-protein phosphatase Lar [Diplonema papillatum]|nr:Tyrosine-protein phosphatase Lar [Diplonema papillatum]